MSATLTMFIPLPFHNSTFEHVSTVNGHTSMKRYEQRTHNGHQVIDATLAFFNQQLSGPQGKLWADNNPEILQWLGEGDRSVMTCGAFPGANRAPPVAPLAPNAPVMVRLRAPDNCGGATIEGRPLEIPADGIITVTDAVAEVLRGHGFVAI